MFLNFAFQAWSDVANIEFIQVTDTGVEVDFDIEFKTGYHGDKSLFDGPNGVLAHAYFPQQGSISGDAHFDDDEDFTDGTNFG